MLVERTNLQQKKKTKKKGYRLLNEVQFSLPDERERRGASGTERKKKPTSVIKE